MLLEIRVSEFENSGKSKVTLRAGESTHIISKMKDDERLLLAEDMLIAAKALLGEGMVSRRIDKLGELSIAEMISMLQTNRGVKSVQEIPNEKPCECKFLQDCVDYQCGHGEYCRQRRIAENKPR